jgi:chromatin assembly factor 1 subunit B
MRYRTLEIRWHDSKPISTCDFQPVPFKKARPSPEKGFAGQSYKLATGGEDNHVRVSPQLLCHSANNPLRVVELTGCRVVVQIWLVHPNITPETGSASDHNSTTAPIQRPPRVEYLATLSRHSAAVNVARFSPNGTYLERVFCPIDGCV